MDLQLAFNLAVGICGFLGGWILKHLYETIHDLQIVDAQLTDKVQAIEVLVAGQYVKRDDLERNINAIFAKLDRIEAKLDLKADK